MPRSFGQECAVGDATVDQQLARRAGVKVRYVLFLAAAAAGDKNLRDFPVRL